MIKRSTVLAATMGLLYASSLAIAQICPVVILDVDAKPVVTRGRPLTFKAEVTNAGSEALKNYEIIVNIPPSATVRKGPGMHKNPLSDPARFIWQVPSLAVGKTQKLMLRLDVDKCAPDRLSIATTGNLANSNSTRLGSCFAHAPGTLVLVKGENKRDTSADIPEGFTSWQQLASLYDAYPQSANLAEYVPAGIACVGPYALCEFAMCRIVSTDTDPPLAECGCYGQPAPTGEDAINLSAVNLLLSTSAQTANAACTDLACVQSAPVCAQYNAKPKPTIYDSKYDLISTWNEFTWPQQYESGNTNQCTSGQYTNCCTAGCFDRPAFNGANTTSNCPVYNIKPEDESIFFQGQGTCHGSKGFSVQHHLGKWDGFGYNLATSVVR